MNESSDYSLNEESSAYVHAEELEFPDWNGQVASRSRMPKDQWLAYCRSNLARLRARPGYAETRLQDGIAVEFRL